LLQVYAIQLARRDVPAAAAARDLLPFVRRPPFAADATAVQRLVDCFVVAVLRSTPRSRAAAIDAVAAALGDVLTPATSAATTTTTTTTTTVTSPDVKKRRLAAELAICTDSVSSPPRKQTAAGTTNAGATSTTATSALGIKRRLYDADDHATKRVVNFVDESRARGVGDESGARDASSDSLLASVLSTARAAATVAPNDVLTPTHVMALDVMARVAFALMLSTRSPPATADAALGAVGLYARMATDIISHAKVRRHVRVVLCCEISLTARRSGMRQRRLRARCVDLCC
jgi:hypothetical protein